MKITGVILAAGKGARLLPFTQHYPKPILPVGNRPLLLHQIETMKSLGITEIIIVIGYLGYEIVKALGDGSAYGVSIRYIEQRETLGIAHAVYKLEPEIHTPILLFLGDIFFRTTQLGRMIETFAKGNIAGVLATKEESNPEAISRNFSLVLDDVGRVKRVIEKPRHVHNRLKGCGIYLFDLDIFDALRRTPRTAMRDEYELTDAIQIMIDDGHTVVNENVIEEDINLTYPPDLLICNLRHLEETGQDVLIGEGCRIHPGAILEAAVVGDGAVIPEPITVKRSVIFPGVTVTPEMGALYNSIVIPNQKIVC